MTKSRSKQSDDEQVSLIFIPSVEGFNFVFSTFTTEYEPITQYEFLIVGGLKEYAFLVDNPLVIVFSLFVASFHVVPVG